MKKTLSSVVLTGALLSSVLASPALADNDRDDDDAVVTLLTDSKISWARGSSEWINFSWTSSEDLRNVKVHLERVSNGLEVEYPSEAEYSRLGTDGTLSESEIDFTAIKLTTTGNGTKRADVVISWDDEDGDRQEQSTRVRLTNKRYSGEQFSVLTEEASVGTDGENPAANWIDLGYKGIAPTTRNMAMTIESVLPVYYPQETFTSLHHDEILHGGETDVARIWFDPALIEAGVYDVTVRVDYVDTNGKNQSESHRIELTVE